MAAVDFLRDQGLSVRKRGMRVGEQSSSARRGRWEFSSTVALSTPCVGINTVDCRDRSFGLFRLIWSEPAQLAHLPEVMPAKGIAMTAAPLSPNPAPHLKSENLTSRNIHPVSARRDA